RAPELSATSRIDRIWIMASSFLHLRGAVDDARHGPALAGAHRARLGDGDRVAHLRCVALVVRQEARRPLLRLAVDRMLHPAHDRHDDALLHLVAHDHTLEFCLRRHAYFAFSFRMVLMRARSRRTPRIRPGASSCPSDFLMRIRKSSSSSSSSLARSPSVSRSLNSTAFMTPSPRQSGSRTWCGSAAWP